MPVPVLMATLRKEFGFQHNAKPPRTWLLGFIPWKRVSTAYGYSQALDATWAQYQRETGNESADRTDFADAVDFVGWYDAKTAKSLASRQTTHTISTSPTILAGRATSAATGKRSPACRLTPAKRSRRRAITLPSSSRATRRRKAKRSDSPLKFFAFPSFSASVGSKADGTSSSSL